MSSMYASQAFEMVRSTLGKGWSSTRRGVDAVKSRNLIDAGVDAVANTYRRMPSMSSMAGAGRDALVSGIRGRHGKMPLVAAGAAASVGGYTAYDEDGSGFDIGMRAAGYGAAGFGAGMLGVGARSGVRRLGTPAKSWAGREWRAAGNRMMAKRGTADILSGAGTPMAYGSPVGF